jgi:ABC-type phosphate transport system permease subunit
MVLLALVGLFLFFRSGEAMSVAGFSFFTEVKWDLASTPPQFGVLGLLSVLARSGRRPRSPRRPTAPTAG